jgi:monothiol glutaredoxin
MSENQLRDAIAEAIRENDVILFMKGTPDQPMCGFSMKAAGALQEVGVPFAAVDVLPDPRIRQELTAVSEWPTIPQLFVKGELLGGSDIIVEMFQSGELHEAVGAEKPAETPEPPPAAPSQPAPLGIENRLD